MSLLEETIALANSTELDRADICLACDVGVRWYQKVLKGQIPEPSVVKIQRLHDYLVSHTKMRRAKKAAA